jgi:hypothetical protein
MKPQPEGELMQIAAVLLLAGFWIMTFIIVNRALRHTGWSMAEALAEDGQASSSRLIAFIFAVIAAGFLMGVSLYSLDRLFADNKMPDLAGVFQLLGTMTTMFIPYGINRFAGAIESRSANPFGVLGPGGTPQPTTAGQLQIFSVQGSLQSGAPTVLTLLGTGFAQTMAVVLTDLKNGQAIGQANVVSVSSAVQAQVTVTPGPATKGQMAVLQISNGVQKAVSTALAIS